MSDRAPALVGPDWLARRRGQARTLVLDTTTGLPGERFDARAHYHDGHIPGARPLDLELFADPDTALPHMIPSPGRFARIAGSLGIADTDTIVLSDSRRLFAAPRAWFLFRLHGCENVHVLDGGLEAWRRSGQPVETGDAPPPPEPAIFTPRLRARMLAGLGDIERLAGGEAVILDARSPERFAGTAPEPRPSIRSGHIPGSLNLPYGRLLDEDGRFRPPADLRALFGELGATDGRSVVTSCGTGVTASILTLGLEIAGIRNTSLFDGSWTEYATAHP